MSKVDQSLEGSLTEFQFLSQLRREVNMGSVLLSETVSDDGRFVDCLKELNQRGVKCIHNQKYQEGLVYLEEAEKLLEFAANCGKTIDRTLIISTLHNEAAAYQKLWELEKTSNYLEAIIYNMNTYIQCPPDAIMMPEFQPSSPAYHHFSNFVQKRLNLAIYYLKFSAVNSQIKKHQVALDSAYKALSIFKLVCEECYKYESQMELSSQQPLQDLLKQLSSIREHLDSDKIAHYLILAKKSLTTIKKNIVTDHKYEKEREMISEFSIGEVMQVCPISLNDNQGEATLESQISYGSKMMKAIYISICFFAIATELRLLSQENISPNSLSPIKQTKELKSSKVYHLNALIIACKYLPEDNQFVDHLLKSFNAHFDIILEPNNTVLDEDVLQDLIIFQKRQQIEINVQSQLNQQKKTTREPMKISNHLTQNTSNIKTPNILEKQKEKAAFGKSKSKYKSTERAQSKYIYHQNIKRRQPSYCQLKQKGKAEKKNSIEKKKSRSKDKSKSLSKRQASQEKKSTEKKKKKKDKLKEQYFQKQETKKKKTKKQNLISHGKISDYINLGSLKNLNAKSTISGSQSKNK